MRHKTEILNAVDVLVHLPTLEMRVAWNSLAMYPEMFMPRFKFIAVVVPEI